MSVCSRNEYIPSSAGKYLKTTSYRMIQRPHELRLVLIVDWVERLILELG